jgi:hypothetical protein
MFFVQKKNNPWIPGNLGISFRFLTLCKRKILGARITPEVS